MTYTPTSVGNFSWSVPLFGNGTSTSPSLRFVNDLDTGIYLHANNTIGFTANGQSVMTVNDVTGLSISDGTSIGNIDANNITQGTVSDSVLNGSYTISGLTVTDGVPTINVVGTSTSQYQGSKLQLINGADTSTRKNASMGTAVKNADGNSSYFYIDSLNADLSYQSTLASYDMEWNRWSFQTNGSEKMAIEWNGNTTLTGSFHPSANITYDLGSNDKRWRDLWLSGSTLYIGDARISAQDQTISLNGPLSTHGDVTESASDERLKSDIRPLENALESVRKMRGYRFTWREDVPGLPAPGQPDVGLLAQEVRDAGFTECVAKAPFDVDPSTGGSVSGEDYLTVKYNKMHAITIQALNELLDRVEALEQRP